MKKERILVWYWMNDKKLRNMGELFVELILDSLKCKFVKYDLESKKGKLGEYDECLMIIGSDLIKEHIDKLKIKKILIWGMGKGMSGKSYSGRDCYDFDLSKEPYKSKIKIFALRGPKTQKDLNLKNIPLGDPGFLLPYLCNIKKEKNENILFVPHHRNRENIVSKLKELNADDYLDIFMFKKDLQKNIKRIISSKFVLTNSLHCSILAQAYGVPWALSLLKGERLNQPEKWEDLRLFLKLKDKILPVKNYSEGKEWWNKNLKDKKIPSLIPLLESFPYPLKPEIRGEVKRKLNKIYKS